MKKQLSDSQKDFIYAAEKRLEFLNKMLESIDNPENKLLIYKEAYGIFAELNKIAGFKLKPTKLTSANSKVTTVYGYFDDSKKLVPKTFRLPDETVPKHSFYDGAASDLLEVISFIRNLFFHFPIFNTWNDIYINKQNSKDLHLLNGVPSESGEIYKFISTLKFSNHFTFNGIKITYPNIDTQPTENIYLKDILSESDAMPLLMNGMKHVFLDKLREKFDNFFVT